MKKDWKKVSNKRETKAEQLKKLAALSERELMMELRTSPRGLTNADAKERLEHYGTNEVTVQKPTPKLVLFLESFEDPFVLVLALLLLISCFTKDFEAAIVMGVMILCSVCLHFIQTYRSQKASFALKEMIENTCAVTRDGKTSEIPMTEVVPGDVVTLSTGDIIPADAVLIQTKDLFVNQSSLTGESLPVEKFVKAEIEPQEVSSALDLHNLIFMGTDVLSGQGQAIILKTGHQTFFGDLAKSSLHKRGQTNYDAGMRQVSKLLLTMVMILFPVVFLLNGLTKGDWLQAFFFAIAVAVGLTPEMLPMIVTSNLAKGALSLSRKQVIVKELSAIQNLGSMDVLCTDKTGTITEDRVVLVKHVNPLGEEDDRVLDYAYLNSNYQTGWKNLMDHAVLNFFEEQQHTLAFQKIEKVDEIPFDFSRRRLTVVVKADEEQIMVTKGAVEEMEQVCKFVRIGEEIVPLTEELRRKIHEINRKMNEAGMRVLTVSYKKNVHQSAIYSVEDEKEMIMIGFMGFLDPAKQSAKTAISSLQDHGVTVKVLTGDNEIVARKVCQDVGIPVDQVVIGEDIEKLSNDELGMLVEKVNLFAKLEPLQKARIIQVLQENQHTVGFMGDGINDAPALRKADVGISVDTAADITKDASSIILLQKSLDVLEDGIIEGRKVFCNMMKYLKITLSSNFGNVFSVLVASAFLPFLPMLSIQLLVQNLLYDLAQLTIPWDNVDEDSLNQPVKWQTKSLLRFTLLLGPVSSIFDILTFIVLWFGFGINASAEQHLFQTGWFLMGLISQILVVHVVRTSKFPLLKSHSSLLVAVSSIIAIVTGMLIVFTPLRTVFDFAVMPKSYGFALIGLVSSYLITVELAKRGYMKLYKEWI